MCPRRKKRLAFEGLENRTVMTGNVTAVVTDGSLVVTGDSADNGITITQTAVGTYVVTGDATTTVNGAALATPATLTNVTKSFKLDMGAGNDTTTIQSLTVPKHLKYQGGAGNDALTLTNVLVSQSAFLKGNDGTDTFTLNAGANPGTPVTGVKVGKTLAINGGDDTDTVNLNSVRGDYLIVNSRRGNDVVTKTNIDFDEKLTTNKKWSPKVADRVFDAWVGAFA